MNEWNYIGYGDIGLTYQNTNTGKQITVPFPKWIQDSFENDMAEILRMRQELDAIRSQSRPQTRFKGTK